MVGYEDQISGDKRILLGDLGASSDEPAAGW